VFFEVSDEFGADLSANPDAFLLASIMPAMDWGERRVRIDGAVCPALRDGLLAAFRVISTWFPERHGPTIEPTGGFAPAQPRTPARVAAFMSGGIDALATLRSNRLNFPLDHPASIQDGFFFFGFTRHDFDGGEPVPERAEDFQRRLARMAGLAREARITLIPVYSNIRSIARDKESWSTRGLGASLASIGHALGHRVSRVLIPSGPEGIGPPWGSHPLLDPNFSSAGLEVHHDGLWLSRFQKTALVAEWDAALAIAHCCWQEQLTTEAINCGRCGKCLRTMIQLAALGALERTNAFPTRDVSPKMIQSIPIDAWLVRHLVACLEPFLRRGRPDLAAAIQRRIDEHRHAVARAGGWREVVREWDRHLTGGRLRRSFCRLRG
jgi:hypothetical protein